MAHDNNNVSTVNQEELRLLIGGSPTVDMDESGNNNLEGSQVPPVIPSSAAEKHVRTEADAKTESARKTGKTLVKKVNKYVEKTGSKAFLKIEYKGTGSQFKFEAGNPWDGMLEEKKGTVEIDMTAVQDAVRQGVKEGMELILPQPSSSSSVTGSSLSPQKRPLDDGTCWICSKKEFILNSLVYNVQWIGCSVDECPNFVHDICLGMPGLAQEDVEDLKDVYCPVHLVTGLTLKNVKSKLYTRSQAGGSVPAKRGRRGNKSSN